MVAQYLFHYYDTGCGLDYTAITTDFCTIKLFFIIMKKFLLENSVVLRKRENMLNAKLKQ